MRYQGLICLGLIIVILAVYWRAGDNQFVNYDDDVYVTNNPHVASGVNGSSIFWAFTSVQGSNWHPVTWLSHMADVQFYGMNPRGHHLTNVGIHTVSTVLLFLLLFRLTGSLWQCSFVAALFALHPLHVESVAWVAERKDVLSAFFWFLSLFFYTAYVAKRKPAPYLLSLASFLLGLMSKPMLVTLPVVMLLMDFWPLNRCCPKGHAAGQPRLPVALSQLAPLVKEKIPFFICSFFSALVTIYAQHKGGAMSSLAGLPLVFRVENAIVAYVRYIIKTLWPQDLAVFYPLPVSIPLWQVFCSLLALILVSAATIRCSRRHPYLLVGWFWFLVTLVPVIGLVQVGLQSMADRYTYIPATGLFIMAAWGTPALTKDLYYRRGILGLLAGAAIIASTAVTWRQIGYWRDDVSLFSHTIHVTSGNFVAHVSLAVALAKKGDMDAAKQEFHEALAIRPDDINAHTSLGLVLAKEGNLDAAIKEYQEALRLNPDFKLAHNNLGIALANKGNLDAAIREFQEVLRIDPRNGDARDNLGFALAQKRMYDKLRK